MKAHEIAPNVGATHRKRRVGRGISAGQGKTAGRGTKGYGARRGGGGKLYRQGGNLPFYRSLPFKRGFINLFRVEFQEINVRDLQDLGAETVSPEQMFAAGLISNLGWAWHSTAALGTVSVSTTSSRRNRPAMAYRPAGRQ